MRIPGSDRGAIGSAALILVGGLILVVILLVGTLGGACDAVFEDESEKDDLGAPALVLDHDGCWDEYDCGGQSYDGQWSNDQNNHNRRNRGAFSPGPFEDSPVDAFNGNTICLPGSTCTPREEERRA